MKKKIALFLALTLAAVMLCCGALAEQTLPTIDQIKLGEDYQDVTASIKILTNRTDIVDTTYAEYAKQFMELYPNITITYEAVTDYEQIRAEPAPAPVQPGGRLGRHLLHPLHRDQGRPVPVLHPDGQLRHA